MHVIAVCDFRCAHLARRLVLSLRNSGNESAVTIFCDYPDAFEALRQIGQCQLRALPEISVLGAKRAKFTAYAEALKDFGDFVYLDCDIIVLGKLNEIPAPGELRATPDDLSACDFIQDRQHPWPGDPGLINRCYFNSGVLYIPSELAGFFERLHELSLKEECWQRHIFPGRLYDNHFLCAHLNIDAIPVDSLDAEQFNWQGFIKRGELQVVRRGGELVNRHTGRPLKLAHFAGIQDIDSTLCSLPVDVTSLLCERSTLVAATPNHAFTELQASVSGQFREPLRDRFVNTVFEHLRSELLNLTERWGQDSQFRGSYFADADSLLSLVYSHPNSDILWNGLQCGGAYLEGVEYNYLAQLLQAARIQTVVEIGAGETSLLMRMKGIRSLAIDSTQGPCLKRAQGAGCQAIHVPLLSDNHMFDPKALELALEAMPKAVDLIFVDSPVGTKNRSRVLTQLLRALQPRLVLFHHAHRDATNLYAYQLEHNLRLVDYLPSQRGMALLSFVNQEIGLVLKRSEMTSILQGRWSLNAFEPRRTVAAGAEFNLRIELDNLGPHMLSSLYSNPVHVSYHWLNGDGVAVIYDGLRTPLPFDIYPGDSATFPVRVTAPNLTGVFTLQIALVQEMVSWFDSPGESLSCSFEVGYKAALEAPQNPVTSAPIPYSGVQPFDVKAASREEILKSLHIITADIEADAAFIEIYERCKKYTITSLERMYAMWEAVIYISRLRLPGDIVECGTWMGGNGMLAALALSEVHDCDRQIWLYDTFEGMSRPSTEDVRHDGQDASPLWEHYRSSGEASEWWSAHYDVVRENMLSTNFPEERLKLVKGKVEDTIPSQAPARISLLRLDTDWYCSTRHEMFHLFPRLVSGGVLIIDDYGWWQGSRRAVDQYLELHGIHLLLNRIDSCGARMAIKT